MVRCSTVLLVVTALLAVALAVMFYQPLPDTLAEPWTIRIFGFRFMLIFIKSELLALVGYKKMDVLRSGINGLMKSMESGQDFSKTITKTDLNLDGVPVRMYRPNSVDGLLPVVIWYHGGGWVLGNVESTDDTSSYIARERKIVVISVEYRLAPENPFPAGFDDCVTATKYVLQNGQKLNVDSKRVAIGGDSAGGNIAAAMAIYLRDQGVKPALSAQVLMYAPLQMCDFSLPMWQIKQEFEGSKMGHTSWSFFLGSYLELSENQTKMVAADKFLTPEMQTQCRKFVDYKLIPAKMVPDGYKPDDQAVNPVNDDAKLISQKVSDLRVSPLLAPSLKRLPATLIVSTNWDYVRDDSPIFSKRLEQDGGNVKWIHLGDSFHGCFSTFGQTKTGKKSMDAVIEFLADTL